MKIYLATDHAGFEMKEMLHSFLLAEGYEVEDCGAYTMNNNDDYPEVLSPAIHALAEDIARGKDVRGIILGGSGQGEAMLANMFPLVRATVYYGGSKDIITLSREHNNANVLSLGARFLDIEAAKTAVLLWLNTKFSGDDRHKRRIAEMQKIRTMNL